MMSGDHRWLSAFSSSTWGWEKAWAQAFLKTQLIEVILGTLILIVITRKGSITRGQFSVKHQILILIIASAITHPPLWFVLPHFFDLSMTQSYMTYLILGEVLVILVEAWWYRETLISPLKMRWLNAFAFSCTLNGVSALYGLYESGWLIGENG